MFLNYFRIALRNMMKQKGYSAINIIGLAVALAACILILLYVRDELSYDDYHKRAENIYAVNFRGNVGGNLLDAAFTPAPLATTLKQDFPEVVNAVRFYKNVADADKPVEYDDREFYEPGFIWADSTVFEMFSFTLLSGDPKSALNKPNTVVITESMARKYFGAEDPVGKRLRFDNSEYYTVTGVMRDVPTNSHFHFDFLASYTTLPISRNPLWIQASSYTYIELQDGASVAQLEAKFPEFIRKYAAPQIEQVTGRTFDEALAAGLSLEFYTMPLQDIYLHSKAQHDFATMSDIKYVYILLAVAAFLLIIACINFMNLSTARSAGRAREVGMRKVFGSVRVQLIKQFLGESLITATIALAVALLLAELALPAFNNLAGKELILTAEPAANLGLFAILIGLTAVVGLLAGIYPAFILSSFRPVAVLKGEVARGASNAWLRNTLVIVQFAISIGCIVGTAIVFNQLRFMQNKNLGFNREQIVVVPIQTDRARQNFDSFRGELLANPMVMNASAASATPGRFDLYRSFIPENAIREANYLAMYIFANHDFVETLDMQMVAGRDFSRDFPSDTVDAYIVNESALRMMEIEPEEAIGMRLTERARGIRTGRIIGVMKDFHFESFHRDIQPLVLRMNPMAYNYAAIRIRPLEVASTLDFIEKKWHAYEPGYPFDYYFLDDDFGRLFEREERLGQIFGYFTLLNVLVASLGLFSLASYLTERRTREIGVRKVLGASSQSIILMLGRNFARLVLVAMVLAFPLAYFAMQVWLEDFAYRTSIDFAVFIGAGILALLIAMATVSFQSLKAAFLNPAAALRYE